MNHNRWFVWHLSTTEFPAEFTPVYCALCAAAWWRAQAPSLGSLLQACSRRRNLKPCALQGSHLYMLHLAQFCDPQSSFHSTIFRLFLEVRFASLPPPLFSSFLESRVPAPPPPLPRAVIPSSSDRAVTLGRSVIRFRTTINTQSGAVTSQVSRVVKIVCSFQQQQH